MESTTPPPTPPAPGSDIPQTELSPLFTEPPTPEPPTPPPPFPEITTESVEPRSVRDETSPELNAAGVPKYQLVLKFKPKCHPCRSRQQPCFRGYNVSSSQCDPCRLAKRRCVGKGDPEPGGWSVDPEGNLYKDDAEDPSSTMEPKEYPPISPKSRAKYKDWSLSKFLFH